MTRLTTLMSLAFAAVPLGLLAVQPTKAPSRTQKEQALQVVTLLKGRCSSCHAGPNAKAKLDLTTPAGLKAGGRSGSLFTPGNSKNSLLIERLQGGGDMDQMPLNFAPFTPDEIKLVAEWIDAGALCDVSNKDHWAYEAPMLPLVPPVAEPSWVKNPIDHFILARLEKEHLPHAPAAGRETLIRRVTLDLTGLPPSLQEIDDFVSDQSPNAYEKVVDRLLASPHFGERQARPWLDLARYADSDGYEKDLNRTAFKWRDWVIDAYNRNMPFDEFTIEQIAGDQLPNPTVAQLIATGFQRNSMLNLEGGVDQAEAHFNVVLDRVNTTSTVWLGSTMACARCHDHKYDPFTQKDYYAMSAFYNNAIILPRGPKELGEEKWYETFMPVPSKEQLAKKVKLTNKLGLLQRKLMDWSPSVQTAFSDWRLAVAKNVPWSAFAPTSLSASGGANLALQKDQTVQVGGENPDRTIYTLSGHSDAGKVTGLRLEAMPQADLVNGGPGRSDNGNFVVNSIVVKVNDRPVPIVTATADFEQPDFQAIKILNSNDDEGWAVLRGSGQPHELIAEFAAPVDLQPTDVVTVAIAHQSKYVRHTLGRFRLSWTNAPSPAMSLAPVEIQTLARKQTSTTMENATLRSYFAERTPLLAKSREARNQTNFELVKVNEQIPSAMIMRDKPAKGPLTANVRTRGEWLSKADLVTAAAPAVLPQIANDKARRLDLAKWLVSKKNPLTARVQVNRMWEQYFGRGIVETTEDFGTQSSPPSHPELLDYLAIKFMNGGWDVKAMHKLIVMSAAYRQSSNSNAKLNEVDPSNVLLARGPRFRMEAEMIRDCGLSASGLLNQKVGGPSVFPYQPAGTWNNGISGEDWTPSTGADRYRRSLYTFWKRTAAYPVFMAFDATSREECTVRRIRTNTPLQALALLNDPGAFDAAKALGARMALSKSVNAGVTEGFRLCTSRHPTSFELKRLEALHDKLVTTYRTQPDQSKKVAKTPELAAWTMVANTMLNLDEAVTKE